MFDNLEVQTLQELAVYREFLEAVKEARHREAMRIATVNDDLFSVEDDGLCITVRALKPETLQQAYQSM